MRLRRVRGFQTTNWMEQNRELFRALKLEQVVTFIVLALIVCVAALNILIALTMMVMEKTRDIAVLMSFGVTTEQVRRVFLFQGLLISVIGTVIGMIVGYSLSWAGGHYRFIRLDAAGVLDRLPPVRAAHDGCGDRGGGIVRGESGRYNLSQWKWRRRSCRRRHCGMSEVRLKYGQLAPEGLARMTALEHYLNTESGLESNLSMMVRLLASLMNGCEYCIRLHTAELKRLNEAPERIEGLAEWRSSTAYTQRERAALAWTEAVTNIQEGHAPDAVYEEVRAHFTDVETVNLTLVITTINA